MTAAETQLRGCDEEALLASDLEQAVAEGVQQESAAPGSSLGGWRRAPLLMVAAMALMGAAAWLSAPSGYGGLSLGSAGDSLELKSKHKSKSKKSKKPKLSWDHGFEVLGQGTCGTGPANDAACSCRPPFKPFGMKLKEAVAWCRKDEECQAVASDGGMGSIFYFTVMQPNRLELECHEEYVNAVCASEEAFTCYHKISMPMPGRIVNGTTETEEGEETEEAPEEDEEDEEAEDEEQDEEAEDEEQDEEAEDEEQDEEDNEADSEDAEDAEDEE